MNFINEFIASFQSGSIAGYVLTGMYAVILVLALVGALKGLTRGTVRQVVRTLTVAASAVVSYILCLKIFPFISQQLDGKTFGEALEALKMGKLLDYLKDYKEVIAGLDAETAEYLTAIPLSVVVLPMIFVGAFVVISAIMMIVHALLCAVLGANGKRANPISRLLGFIIGAGQGAAVGALLLIPVVSISVFAKNAMAEIDDGSDLKAVYTAYAETEAESDLVGLIRQCGGDYVMKGFNTLNIDGEDVDVSESAKSVFVSYSKLSALKGVDFKQLTKSEQDVIKEVSDIICDDHYLATVFAGILRNGATVIKSNPNLIPADNPTVNELLGEFLTIFETTTATDFSADLRTIENVYFILCNTGVLNATASGEQDSVINAMNVKDPETGKTVVEQVVGELEKNPHTSRLVSTMARFAISVMLDNLSDEAKEVMEIYDNMKESLQEDVLSLKRDDFATDEEYADKVAENLTDVLAENGIELPPEVSENMADYIVENIDTLAGVDLADADIDSILLQYFASAAAGVTP
ncbi:MAG: CvpA family protein [Clostridia bacterium]|nr:CvpA family protein [Clostridia bacterium]